MFPQKKFKRVKLKPLDSDEDEEEQPERAEKQAISSKLFEGDETGDEVGLKKHTYRQ